MLIQRSVEVRLVQHPSFLISCIFNFEQYVSGSYVPDNGLFMFLDFWFAYVFRRLICSDFE